MPPSAETPSLATYTEDRAHKRRRLSPTEQRRTYNQASPTPSSGDELCIDNDTPSHGPLSQSRSSLMSRVQQHTPRRSLDRRSSIPYHIDDEEDSPDELDHTFLRVKQEHLPHRRTSQSSLNTSIKGNAIADRSDTATPTINNTPQDSDLDPASSAIASPAPLAYDEEEVPPPRPEVRYEPQLVLRGHKRGVSMVKFSPDGKWIASSSADTTCKVWDAYTGALQQTLHAHLAGISTIAWSPDSKILASGSDDKSIRLWDVAKGKSHPYALLGHHNYVYSVAFSPKGNMLVSGSYDEAVFLWDVRTGRLMRSLPAHSDPVGGVDFVRDGTLMVSCASDGLIRVWDTATGQCLRTFFHEDTPPVVSVKFSPNGRYILAWMLDSSLRMWNYIEGRCVKTYQGHENIKYSLSGAFGTYRLATPEVGEDGDNTKALVVSGSEDGCILIWDVVSKDVLQKFAGHRGAVLSVDTHPTEKMIVSCGLDKTIKIWKDTLS